MAKQRPCPQAHRLFRSSRAAIVAAWLVGVYVMGGFVVGRDAQAAPVRVMPVGDSITVGIGDGNNGGYRGPLGQSLVSGGYSVDFVGTQTGGTIPDPDHEGHSGWRADQVRDNIMNWLVANPPDIILLHIGTNDITQNEHAPGITSEITQILNNIDTYESYYHTTITVVLARIINRSTPTSSLGLETTALNNSIATMAAARIAAGDHLVVVDQEPALSYPADLVDAVHPNGSGYAKMSAVWYSALTPLLRSKATFVSDTLPSMMMPGQSYSCNVVMQNVGRFAWQCSPDNTMLTVRQSNGPGGGQLLPEPYQSIPISPCVINVGQSCTFPFTINVPANTPLGSYEISWQMKDNTEWFDSNGHEAIFHKNVAVRLHPLYTGDFDDDGDVDQHDFGHLQICLSGTGVVQSESSCQDARLDGDTDVDENDVAIFYPCMNGAEVPAKASCIK